MNEYKIQNIIGQGAFGNAYLATHLHQNKKYVIKKVQLANKNEEQTEKILNQVRFLEEFKHVNIVSYRESIIEGRYLNIIMEFCHCGDLNQLITEQKENHGGRKLDEKKVIDWAAQIALAIFYMHDKRILHRDIKTPNIFISDKIVKLGDFGISKVLDEKVDLASTSIGTPYYMSPEQYKHKPYSYKSDMWAFGCILYEMCNQKRPFEALSINGLAVKVLEANYSPVSDFYGPELKLLINKMLQKKEKDRPTILQFLQTPIIKRRAAIYLRQTYNKLIQEKGEKALIDGVLYQAKKLGISFSADKKEGEGQKKTVKPEFTAERKKQEKERIRQQLEQQLRKISEKDKQQKEQLKKLTQDRKNIVKRTKKQPDRSSLYGRKGSQSSIQKTREQTAESKSSLAQKSKQEEKPKSFQIKEKYDMYEMEYQEEEEDSDNDLTEVIAEVEEQEEKEVKQQIPYQKEKYTQSVSKESKIQGSRFTQLAPQENQSNIQVPIEEAITNLKESLKNNYEKANTIKNQLSNIDFSISSSEDEFQKTIEKPEELPMMKKKQRNPVHVMLSDKVNEIKQSLESILPVERVQKLEGLAQTRGDSATRTQIEKVVGSRVGTYHLAFQMSKLKTMLSRVPAYS